MRRREGRHRAQLGLSCVERVRSRPLSFCVCACALPPSFAQDKLAHFDRERIPERVVHAKGAGAHGFFEVTHDVTGYSKAKVFARVGKRTPLFARFSTVGGERGSADTARDPRGFAIKHYTEEGIWSVDERQHRTAQEEGGDDAQRPRGDPQLE